MSAWESFGSTYLEAVSAALPLHRLVLFVFGLIGSIAVKHQTHLSALESLSNIRLGELIDFKSPLLKDATVANVFIGIGLVLAGWIIARALIWLTFTLASKATNLSKNIPQHPANIAQDELVPPNDRQQMVALIEASLEIPRVRLRAMNALVELSGGMAAGCAVVSIWGNATDIVASIIFLFTAICISIFAVKLFFNEYFGPALYIAQLQGKPPPTPVL